MRLIAALLVCGLLASTASAELLVTLVDDYPGTFTDISATGTEMPLADDAEGVTTWSQGNDIWPAGNVYVANNGAIGKGIGWGVNPGNTILGGSGACFAGQIALAPYWDDFGDTANGNIHFQEMLDGTFIVQWTDAPSWISGGASAATFQVKLFPESFYPLRAQFIYEDIEDPGLMGLSATIGYQTGWSDVDKIEHIVQGWDYDYPDPPDEFDTLVLNGDVLSFVPEPTTLSLLGFGALALIRRR